MKKNVNVFYNDLSVDGLITYFIVGLNEPYFGIMVKMWLIKIAWYLFLSQEIS